MLNILIAFSSIGQKWVYLGWVRTYFHTNISFELKVLQRTKRYHSTRLEVKNLNMARSQQKEKRKGVIRGKE